MRKAIRILAPLLTAVLLINLFSGCGSSRSTVSENPPAASSNSESLNTAPPNNETTSQSSDTALQADEEPSSLKISYKVYSETIKDDDGTDLVSFKITSPYIDNPNNHKGIDAINEYYEAQFDNFAANTKKEGIEAALEGKKAAKEIGFDFFPFIFEREANIYYNDNNLLSVLHIGFEYTGGAHPSSYWSSETFDVKTGKTLALSDIFGVSKELALEKVYEVALKQIEKTKGTDDFYYFDEYEENVRKNYSENDFVLGPNGIIFYYQLYTIAPYAAGIPTFELPYHEAGNLAVNIPPIKSNELEREAYLQAGKLIEANKDVFYNIFGLSMLPLNVPENAPEGQFLFPVKDERFKTFADLNNYISGIYVKSEADALMGSGRYIDKDGKLYGDLSKDAGMGYYVDWNNYRYEVSDISETSAKITIYTVEDSPAGKEDKIIEVNMIKENDRWLLEKMFS